MGLSLSAATALIIVTLFIVLDICMGSMLPSLSGVRESYDTLTVRMNDQLLTDINITGIIDTAIPWWNESFEFRKRITINSSKVLTDQTNFPVLVNISSDDLRDHVEQANGNDIAFVDSTNTVQLNHEIELFTQGTGRLIAWVNITTVYGETNTRFYIYYGNATCPSQQNPTGVWDSNFVMVQHLNETSGTHYDSTSYNKDGTITGGVTQGTDGLSQLDGGDFFHGDTEYINFGNTITPSLLTVEAWVKDPPILRNPTTNKIANTQINNNNFWIDNTSYAEINFSRFWPQFINTAQWTLQYNQNGTWSDCSTLLTVNYTVVRDDQRKFSLDFTAPYTTEYRLQLLVGLNTTDLIYDSTNKTYNLYYHVGNDFLVMFNYTDITLTPDLEFNYGVTEQKFWFTILHNKTIAAGSKISLDPYYKVTGGGVTGATDSSGYNNGRKLVRTSDGILHCVYHSIPSGNTKNNIYYAKSINSGVTWTNYLLINDSSYDQKYPSIAVNSTDALFVVWQGISGAGRGNRIRYSIKTSRTSSWTAPANITPGDYDQYYPSLAVDSNDKIHVVWAGKHAGSTVNTQIRYANYSNGAWNTKINITGGAFDQLNPTIVIDGNDIRHVIWYGLPNSASSIQQIRYSGNASGSLWKSPVNLTGEGYIQQYPSLAIDTDRNLHVVWQGRYTGSSTTQIRYKKFTRSTSTWSAITNITSGTLAQFTPSIALDGYNYVHVVWRGYNINLDPNTQIRYSNNTGTGWTAPRNLTSGNPSKYYPSLIWAYHPITINVCWPRTGYAFVFTNNTLVYYYASTSLSWQRKQILTMSHDTYSLEINSNGTILYGYIGGKSTSTGIDTNWHHVVLTYDGSQIGLFKDGYSLILIPVLTTLSYPPTVPDITAGKYLTGYIDELRISKINRSSNWINTTYLNQYSPSTFMFFDTEQNKDQIYLNISVENIGKVVLITEDFTIIVNGTLIPSTGTHTYLAPTQIVHFLSNNIMSSGEKRIKVVTEYGIADYYYHPG
ncbi:MAG: DUF2341 domain-containing protein [Methanobacteriota archaeon]